MALYGMLDTEVIRVAVEIIQGAASLLHFWECMSKQELAVGVFSSISAPRVSGTWDRNVHSELIELNLKRG